jgi:protein involved in polysaccharide export with SLBB domain
LRNYNFKLLMNLKKLLVFLLILTCVSAVQVSNAQNGQDLSNVKVDNLTDAQITRYMQQAQSSGMTDDQLAQMAQARGMNPQEVQKLQARVAKLRAGSGTQSVKAPTTVISGNPNGRGIDTTGINVSTADTAKSANALTSLKPKIFGQDLFANALTTFEPNLKIPTPQNYIIGAGDQLNIDIYGYSEANYQLTVSPDGNITIPYAGVTPVAGSTIEAVTSRIKAKLTKAYSGLSNGTTKINISLGNIRSIKVIVNGEVTKPGSYTLPSLATVFNALYASGGPSDNGSFRSIDIIRSGRKIATLDVYDFLINGDLKNNITLRDQDIINVPPYNKRVQVNGEIKRPALFEMKGRETFKDLLTFAGGFTENAYRARVKVLKNTFTERRIDDLTDSQFATYVPESGDKFFVDAILNRFENRVTIAGAVYRPGEFQLTPGLTLKELIQKANGVTEDAFLSRGYITRLTSDLNTEIVPFDVQQVINGQGDIKLQREDIINISSKFDLKEAYNVSINGAVRFPGQFPYSENMSLEELIIKAGGFTESAIPQRIEVSRRVKTSDATSESAQIAQVFQADVNADLSTAASKFVLKPFDIVSIRQSPGYEVQKEIKVSGEILYPGNYTVIRKNERISDVIKRAGGYTGLAFPEGASLKRTGDQNSKFEKEIEQQKLAQLQKLQADAANDTTQANLLQAQGFRNNYVGINLPEIMAHPGGINDLYLEDGDEIFIPKQLQTVKVNGEVLSPVTVIFESNKSFREYVDNAGGFSEKALKKRAYVVYANGKVQSTHKFLFFNSYPKVTQGAEIFVPTKEDKQGLSAQQWISIGSGITTIAAVIVTLLRK